MTNQAAWTSAASIAYNDVHVGTWINWSRGRVMGATLTLDRVQGNLLIAFTAVFVGIVTERFWRIACIVFYRFRSSPQDSDGLYYQQQAVLRNSSSTISAIWTFTQLIWAWHNVAEHCFVQVLPTLFTAVFCFCAFTVAGGFSSSISSGISNEVLLNGTNCGLIHFNTHSRETATIMPPYYSQAAHSAANYAQQCYSSESPGTSDSASMFDCKHFVKDHLFSMVDYQASCPFSESICRSNNSNIRLDTGYLSLANDLGLNAPPDQDIELRAVLHCAPLNTRGYQEAIHLPMNDFITYNYGTLSMSRAWNYTYKVKSLDSQYNREPGNPFRGAGNAFVLNTGYAPVYKRKSYDADSVLRTIPALFSPDADTTLIFLSGNGIEFSQETNDPWYHATTRGDEATVPWYDGANITVYQPDEAASPMGCTSQYQYCNPSLSNNTCGPLASWLDASMESAPLFGMSVQDFRTSTSLPNGTMISRYQWLLMMMGNAAVTTETIINTLGPDSLASPKYLLGGLMGPLPDNQWQLDVQNWWAIFLAALQARVVDTARGSVDPDMDPYKQLPWNSDLRAMCNNQKIRSTRHVSFSLFGLYFTFTTGILIIITSFVMEPIFKCLYNRRKYQEYTYLEWTASETLQLQRIGFQGNNDGTWSGCTDSIPRTEPGQMLRSLARRYSPHGEDKDESGSTSNNTNVNTADASSTANENQEADMVSLDDFLDVVAFSDGDSAVIPADQNLEQTNHMSTTSR